MSQTQSADKPTDMSGVWSVHSEQDNKPSLRGFAKTKEDAQVLLDSLKSEDEEADKTEYWLLELAKGEVNDFVSAGMLDLNQL